MPLTQHTEKVQRLGGGRSQANCWGLKIESVPTERWPRDERCSTQLELGGGVWQSTTVPRLEYTGGAWPFLVGGLPCQVDSGNERDLSLLNSHDRFLRLADFLEGLLLHKTMEV